MTTHISPEMLALFGIQAGLLLSIVALVVGCRRGIKRERAVLVR